MKLRTPLLVIALALVAALGLSSCAWFGGSADDLSRALKGMHGTMTTYNEDGDVIDSIHGDSFDLRRDETFDTVDSEGKSSEDSRVLRISLGKGIIQHVGSTLILAEDGIVAIPDAADKVRLNNSDSGSPWLNSLYHDFRNMWKGKARTIIVRSQNGSPIAVFAGDHVETFAPGIPTTTWFRVDGKTLLVYRADYTVYDTSLLG